MPGLGLGRGLEGLLNNQGGSIWTPPQLANLQYWQHTLKQSTLSLDGSNYCTDFIEQSQNKDTITQATATSQGLYQNSNELYYDGADFYDISSILPSIATSTKGTLMGWINSDDITGQNTILGLGEANAITDFRFYTQTSRFTMLVRIGGSVKWLLELDAISLSSTRYHIAVVQNGAEGDPVIYLNGVAPAQTFTISTTKTAWLNDAPLVDTANQSAIEFNSGGVSAWLLGSTGEVMIWDNNLTASEVLQSYNDTLPYFS